MEFERVSRIFNRILISVIHLHNIYIYIVLSVTDLDEIEFDDSIFAILFYIHTLRPHMSYSMFSIDFKLQLYRLNCPNKSPTHLITQKVLTLSLLRNAGGNAEYRRMRL